VRQRGRQSRPRNPSPQGHARSVWTTLFAPYPARRLADIRRASERCRLSLILHRHFPERVRDLISPRSVGVPCAEMRELHKLVVVHSLTKRGRILGLKPTPEQPAPFRPFRICQAANLTRETRVSASHIPRSACLMIFSAISLVAMSSIALRRRASHTTIEIPSNFRRTISRDFR
jgi:hypothetical protein